MSRCVPRVPVTIEAVSFYLLLAWAVGSRLLLYILLNPR